MFEPLESRMLLAADLLADSGLLQSDLAETDPASECAELAGAGQETPVLAAEGEAEGENGDQRDLRAFAELLTQNQVKFYGSGWCPNCTVLKKAFEDGAQFLTYIDLFNADGTRNNNILPNLQYQPAMEYPDGNGGTILVDDQEGLTLERISALTGIAIPTSSTPWVNPIDETLTVLSGSPLHIPLDGYDPNGDPLTYDITVEDANGNPTDLLTAQVLQDNRSMKMELVSLPGNAPGVAGGAQFYVGELVFELFEQRAPVPSGRVIQLVESGHYDDSYMWRLEHGFVGQFGGVTPTAGGGSNLGVFDDQYHVDLQHNRDGILSFAKGGDDSNDAQFFLTLAQKRGLDFNYSIFGQMVEGYRHLVDIEEEPAFDANPDGDGDPNNDIHSPVYPKQVGAIDIFTDTENGVAMLKATPGAIGQEFTLTVTATDGEHTSAPVVIAVVVADDTPLNDGANGAPFLGPVDDLVVTRRGVPAEIDLTSVDVEGDPVDYYAQNSGDEQYVDVDDATGKVTVTLPADFVGELPVLVAVRGLNGSDTFDPWDTQVTTVHAIGPPTLDLMPVSDSNINTDNITNLGTMTYEVSDAAAGATIKIRSGNTEVGEGVASSAVEITTDNLAALGDGVYFLRAVQILEGVESEPSSILQVTLDRQAPTFTTTPPEKGTKGVELVYDANTDEAVITYSLISQPASATIQADTGILTWTPEAAGTYTFQIEAKDLAGNSTTQALSIDVVEPVVEIILLTTDAEGNPIERIATGSDYQLRALVKDVRQPPSADGGVFSSYLNIMYDSFLVSPNAAGPDDIIFAEEYTWLPSGDFGTLGLVADVGSAAAPDPNSPTLFPPFGPARMLHFAIPMTANNEGEAFFSATPSNDNLLPIAVYSGNGAALPEEVVILGTSLVIGEGLIAHDDVFNVNEDSLNNELDVIDNLLGEDENPQGGPITIISVGATDKGGAVSIVDGNKLSYTPAADFFGVEEFTYTISNGQSTSTATVEVQVQPQNDDPTAVDDAYTVDQNSQNNFLDVTNNDSIVPDQDEELEVVAVVNPNQGGTAEIVPGGSGIDYTPAPGFVGQENVNYTINDGNGGTANAVAVVTVLEGTRPTAVDDEAAVNEDSGATTIEVLVNDQAAVAGQLTVKSVTQPDTGGNVTIGANRANVAYTPAPDFFGTDTFTYTVAEVGGGEATATVTVTINGQNDPPIAVNDEMDVTKDSQNNRLDVVANDIDLPDAGETLTITSLTLDTADQGSTFSISGDGQAILYTPAAGFTGSETVTYTINDRPDGSGLTHQATVTVNVAESTITGWITSAGVQTPIRGLQLSLTHADGQGNAGNDSPQTDTSGSFRSAARPGLYMLQADPFFLSLIEEEVLVISGGNVTVTVPTVRDAGSMSILDFLATAPDRSSLSPNDSILAAVTPGSIPAAGEGESGTGEQHWYSIETGWAGYVDVLVQVPQGLNDITLTATDSNGDRHRTTISANDGVVEFMGREGDARLIRITVDPDTLDWELLTDHSGSGSCSLDPDSGCGEGEAAGPEIAVAIDDEPAQESWSVDVAPVVEPPPAPPVAEELAEGEAAVALSATITEPVVATIVEPAVAVTVPVVAIAEPAREPIAEPTITEAVAESPEPVDSPAYPILGVVTVDASTDAAFVQNHTGDAPVDEQSTTDAVDAVLADTEPEEESAERDLVLAGSQSEAEEFALAVDWLLAGGLD